MLKSAYLCHFLRKITKVRIRSESGKKIENIGIFRHKKKVKTDEKSVVCLPWQYLPQSHG